MTFEQWKAVVDAHMFALYGLCSDDICDYDYQKAYRSRVSPKVAAKRAIANAQ